MTTTQNQPSDETFLDDAATAAVGAHTVEESDAFVQRLAQATVDERRTARELREAAAHLAAAAPYMAPSAGLREKLLAATAPQSFKIDDYRRKGAEGGGFFRWGFAAALMFLAGAAWFNYGLRTQVYTQTQQIAALQGEMATRTGALVAMTDPTIAKIALQQDGKTTGVLMLAPKPVMFLRNVAVPAGLGANIRLTLNGQEHNVFAAVIGAGTPGEGQAAGGSVATELRDVKPSEQPQQVYQAGFPGFGGLLQTGPQPQPGK